MGYMTSLGISYICLRQCGILVAYFIPCIFSLYSDCIIGGIASTYDVVNHFSSTAPREQNCSWMCFCKDWGKMQVLLERHATSDYTLRVLFQWSVVHNFCESWEEVFQRKEIHQTEEVTVFLQSGFPRVQGSTAADNWRLPSIFRDALCQNSASDAVDNADTCSNIFYYKYLSNPFL